MKIETNKNCSRHKIDWSKVNHWTDLKKVMMAMDLSVWDDPEKPSDQFDSIRHLMVAADE